MDFKTLERLWASHDNNLSKTAEAYILEDMMNTLKNRRNRFYLWMGFVGVKLALFTALVVYIFLVRQNTDVSKEWALLLMLAVPWIGFIVFKLQYHRHLRAFPNPDLPMQQSLNALLDENLTAQRRSRAMAIMHAVFAVVMVVALWQLMQVGKMEPRHVLQAGLLFGGGLLLSTIVQAVVYFHVTKPEAQRLRRLIGEYESPT